MMKSILTGAAVLFVATWGSVVQARTVNCGASDPCNAGTLTDGDMIEAQSAVPAPKINFDLASGSGLNVLINNDQNQGQWDVRITQPVSGSNPDFVAEKTANAGVAQTFSGLGQNQNYRIRTFESGSMTGQAVMMVSPLPGAVYLLGAGLAGIGFLRRRARKAATV